MIFLQAFVLPFVLFLIRGVSTVKIVELKVPPYALRNSPVRLECHYDPGEDGMDSVRWYKDGREFYRYVPKENPGRLTFPSRGFTVNWYNSSDRVVSLTPSNHSGSGSYRCEVNGDAPRFTIDSTQKEMLVVDTPKQGPIISGLEPRYNAGDIVQVNCTSSSSIPATNLSWFINGELITDDALLKQYPVVIDSEGLESVTLGLQFKLRLKHYRKGDLKLKCVSTLAQFYARSNELSVPGPRVQRAPVLERRSSELEQSNRGPILHLSLVPFVLCLMTTLVVVVERKQVCSEMDYVIRNKLNTSSDEWGSVCCRSSRMNKCGP